MGKDNGVVATMKADTVTAQDVSTNSVNGVPGEEIGAMKGATGNVQNQLNGLREAMLKIPDGNLFVRKAGDKMTGNLFVEHGKENIGAQIGARRADTGAGAWVGVGTAGINHGVYSDKYKQWMIYEGDDGVVRIPSNKLYASNIDMVDVLVPDNAGKPKYLLISDITTYWTAAVGKTNLPSRGLVGVIISSRFDGHMVNHIDRVACATSYERVATHGNDYFDMRTTNGEYIPTVIHNIADNTYHLALRVSNSGRHIRIIGSFDSAYWEGTFINTINGGGDLPDGYEIAYSDFSYWTVGGNLLAKPTTAMYGGFKPDGKSLKVDANGVASAGWVIKQIATNTDLNDIVVPGLYGCLYNGTAQTLTNCPTSFAFSMIVYGMCPPAFVYQEITEYMPDNQKKFMRNKYSDATVNRWGNWVEVGSGVGGGSNPVFTNTPSDTIGALWYE